MFKKQFRLSTFSLTNPRQISTKNFNIKIAENDKEFSRFAFVVSKKIDMRSTARNQLKRKFRSIFEELFDKIEGGVDFIIYPKKSSQEVPRLTLLGEVEKELKQKNIFK